MVLLDIAEASWTTRICNIDSLSLMQIFAVSFLAILFLQSGLDKVFDWKGNLDLAEKSFCKFDIRKSCSDFVGHYYFF